VRTPQLADRWTRLILAALAQLRPASRLVGNYWQRWQAPLPPDAPTPGRVRRGSHLLPHIGTPAIKKDDM
jgi:hypothetical protein